ncbi:glutamate synthase large subunit [Candidatus Thiothrix anitrata]|jgi:glutamate synthase (ferredoxin)|uniref:Glutamate synthase large subunit n=1 Tax=Candidatus Thiothrix anitrata TaxID=2823902 RepID=A0ABX7X2K0_9GAMM|nr:glutamate synthase large subunit [Candidatus Thiothrix anitrata]QTR49003.1 glutamate synthase large subunit [Candidatus Thiothrix anitrata]
MRYTELPPAQGLYDPSFEHDACGMGFVAHLKGVKSHRIVQQALKVLTHMEHRGACGCEENTGDGAGILLQLPHEFLVAECKSLNIKLPAPGDYAVGMVFLPQDADARAEIASVFARVVEEEGQTLLGWRDVPVNSTPIGNTALKAMPFIRMAFLAKSADVAAGIAFERKLYVIRKRTESTVDAAKATGHIYFPSLSSRTIVYKGMLTTEQVGQFYKDLRNPRMETAIAMIHSRFSTNTFPSWERAHPNRYLIHNGEINTMRGNVNWMNARQGVIKTDVFNTGVDKLFPIVNPNGSDSAMFDNTLEFMYLSGYSLPHAMMMMVPEPWSNHESMSAEKKAFYEYHSCLMEPWDGPAAMGFTDGTLVGATLDRNGLRPSRYYLTNDDMIILASEVGVLDDLDQSTVVSKQRLQPGRMLLVDTAQGRIIADEEIKQQMAAAKPYQDWLASNLVELQDLPAAPHVILPEHETLVQRQKMFGYTYEDVRKVLVPMSLTGIDPLGAMGIDSPIAVLSNQAQPLFNYFKQLFAQVTNPPIDSIREEIVTSAYTTLGSEGDITAPTAASCQQILLKTPILDNDELAKLTHINREGFKCVTLPITFRAADGNTALEGAMEHLFAAADKVIGEGANLIVLSDRLADADNAPIPSLLAVSGLHHHLIRNGCRTRVSLILESGEPREVHHFCTLLGYGVQAINPYLAFESLDDLIREGLLPGLKHDYAVQKYIKAVTKGVIKVMSKIGISTIQSYRGAQIFEALGISPAVIDKYFTATASRIGGIDLPTIAKEALIRHQTAYDHHDAEQRSLKAGNVFQWRNEEEEHQYNPATIYTLQKAVKLGDYQLYKQYSRLLHEDAEVKFNLRNLLDFNFAEQPIPLSEVEPASNIVKRFKSGAMSFGSISKEAHEALAIAMNRLGGRSNSGEGGEDPVRFTPDANGDWRNSAIKQVASGRFGVTSHYLNNAQEIQIKLAQGAKPGEGGQLPGKKVYPWVAKVRGTTPGVGLISPPPHHDIYSIEDLAQLIHDLKNANKRARINVKLVSEVGVGTIAAGVAKGKADVILISGYDGGTGASPKTSVQHAGLPWELGLAETHQTLLLNNLRSRVRLETDGKLMTGRDVAIAALLGAEEYGFATLPLVALGCVMMRVCHQDTCPVGIATQNPELRKKYAGDPQYVVNLLMFIAEELREYMAKLGFRTIDEMIGRVDKLRQGEAEGHWKAKTVDLSKLLHQPAVDDCDGIRCLREQDHGIANSLDEQHLLKVCQPAIDQGTAVTAAFEIRNIDRVAGTITGSEVTRKYGAAGLPEDTIRLKFNGSAGQSFGAFIPKGMSLELEGDSNDYIGKGLSGGKIIVYPRKDAQFAAEDNILIGNVAFFGASDGEAYVRGVAGERFCVRNSGVRVVVEGTGDHGCEYMTGGRVVVLGKVGRNFGAGMSGGVAYVYDPTGILAVSGNTEMVSYSPLADADEKVEVKAMIEKHVLHTGSTRGSLILGDWDKYAADFVRVMPNDYQRMLEAIKSFEQQGLSGEEALMAAFTANNSDASRVGGN